MNWSKKLLWILSAWLVLAGCKPRSPTDDPSGDGDAATADSSRVDTLEVLIEALKNQLETNQKMSDAEREALEKQLKAAEEEKTKAEGAPVSGSPAPKPTATPTPAATPTAPKLEGPYNLYYANDCMQPMDASGGDGSIFRSLPCNNTEVQQFTLEMRDNGYFRILHKMSGKCMILEGNMAGEGTPPTLRPCKAVSDNAEHWKFFDAAADGSRFKLQNRTSGMCLKIGTDGSATIFQGNCTTTYTEFMLKKSI
ncbi:MAG TPA: RICIN domain-containing protein [Oligoflexus sp.]|uniref:RICIN domain-containing protein n=1 Tax=Oligoflexus sp. TaxID=1971216 RepID=UPI002D55D641|nr:RICIN domain-containing protein [Oligoflexus sp.]HYX31681.1 RICIN domain-containing protein [Oligoflexus sp.]